MEENKKKKILIIGNCAATYSTAQKMSQLDNVSEVFVAPGSKAMKEFATIIDIRENNTKELLEFALENGIDLTVVISNKAIKEDISTLFSQNGQIIFAPSKSAATISINKPSGKKFMFKNRIPCPHFGIFDKSQNAYDYLKNVSYPIIIKAEEEQNNGVLVCNTVNLAQNYINELFNTGEKKILVEDYIYGHEFSFYIITDGYQALELGCIATYNYELEGNGGLLSAGMGAFADDYKISSAIREKIMHTVVYPTLSALQKSCSPYSGILGIDLVLDNKENIYVTEFNTFLKSPDAQCILPLINQNLYELFEACAVGSFADDYEYIDINNSSTAACVVCSLKDDISIDGVDKINENTSVAYIDAYKNNDSQIIAPHKGRALILSHSASIISRAVNELYEDLKLLKSDHIKYRKDIGKII